MNVAITGASGYVGGRLARAFGTAGHQVLSLSRRPCEAPWRAYALGDDPATLPWGKIDLLIHAAYDFRPRTFAETEAANVEPSIALLKTARAHKTQRIIFISSMSAFEGCRSIYGRAKLSIEREALALGATIVRPGLVWGKQTGGVMGALEKLVATLPVVPVLSGSSRLIQYLINENDLTAAVLLIGASTTPPPAANFTLAHPSALPLRDIVGTIARRNGKSRIMLPVAWQFAMAGLKSLEMIGIHPPFRSDSLTGLVHANPDPSRDSTPFAFPYQPFR